MTPIVFLDIDGVLHTLADRPRVLNADCVRALNWLTEAADAQIVVSSVWRLMPNIKGVLEVGGVQAKVIGTTPYWADPTGARVVPRGEEIEGWLTGDANHRRRRLFNGDGSPNWTRPRPFVILDDDDDMGCLLPYLVQSDFTHGLTMPLAELALGVLERVHA